MPERYSFWRPALAEYIDASMQKPFQWSEHDCALFAAGAVEAMTGEDFAAPYRGKYKSLKGGLGLLKRKGFANHAELAASLLEEIPISLASVGDIAAVKVSTGGFYALGVVNGPRIYLCRPDSLGLGTADLLTAERAFRV
ncbi:hypothetical protein M8997_004075 [Phyllobacterium sp. 21LDTY02-6]|uniref:DUF6950 family protein n=1 Tax=Phyllobacterium sp. 21LDTY02-6 TaxID=2944903 RepID=UPI002020AC1B|nr:hypothetical protein [Phyllobacterium sp. 21LDTY02-6]MCO4316350.1 hypothetical protein [Phyllobacterium sp. 21LDTY02-6]